MLYYPVGNTVVKKRNTLPGLNSFKFNVVCWNSKLTKLLKKLFFKVWIVENFNYIDLIYAGMCVNVKIRFVQVLGALYFT